jgi:hypothetical protein
LKTALNFCMILCLAICLFAFPTPGLADDGLPGGFQMVDGVPVAPAGLRSPLDAERASPGHGPLALHPTEDAFGGVTRGAAAGYTHYLTLTGLDFFPIDSALTYSELNGGLYALGVVAGLGYFAPYHLPEGSTVTAITFYVFDNVANDIALGAYAFDPATESTVTLGSGSTSGTSGAIQAIDLPLGSGSFTIANGTYAYRLGVELTDTASHTQRLFGARISYNLPLVPAVTDYITMAGADLHSASSNTTYVAIGGTVYATAFDPGYGFEKRLDLPQDAVINQVEWFVVDNHADILYLSLFAHGLANNSVTTPASANTTGAPMSTDVQVFTATPSITIENTVRAYSISITPTAASVSQRIVGARVRYTPPATTGFGPQIKNFSGGHFFPSGSSLTYRHLGQAVYALALSSGRSFQVSLGLPNGARIDRVTFFFIDNSAQNITFYVRNYYPVDGSYASLASGASGGTDPDLRLASYEPGETVDTSYAVPLLRAECGVTGSTNLLVGAQVEYSFPLIFLPLVIR